MEIRIRETGEIVSDSAFRALHEPKQLPAVLDPATLDENGADAVLAAPAPTITQFQSVSRDGVVQDGLGNWVYAWSVRDCALGEIIASREALAATLRIDAEADAIRSAVLGGRTTEYQQAEADAAAYKAAGYTGAVPAGVTSWFDAKAAVGAGWTAQQCADDILTTAANWHTAQNAIRAARLLRKAQVDAAAALLDAAQTVEDATAAVASFDAAVAAWNAFAAWIRAQLGL